MDAALDLPGPGMRLGPWLLEADVGAGGMGRIYRASRADGVYAQKVTVKVLRRGMDTDLILKHFQAERPGTGVRTLSWNLSTENR